jgi:transposase
MVEALSAGERDPQVLAALARGRMRLKHAALAEALTGRFDAHHAELARMLLDQIDALTTQISTLTTRIDEQVAAISAAWGADPDGSPGAGTGPDAPILPALDRLDEIPGISRPTAQGIIAEIGLDMSRFPTPGHLVSWAKLSPRTIQSSAKNHAGRTGKGNPYLKAILGRGRHRGCPHRYLPQRTVPADRQAPRQAPRPGRHRPHHPGHYLAPASRPLPRPGRRLLRQPHRSRQEGPQPHPPARSARIHRHPRPAA